jgi:hypothetical protein
MTGIDLIAEERKRQIEVEGWTTEHDAQHSAGEMAVAAACYAVTGLACVFKYNHQTKQNENLWPWDIKWYRPTPDNRIRELQKSGALIAAEIDRLLGQEVIISKDGDQFCATYKDFDCLQTSPAGFGNTPEEAKENLILNSKK